VQQKQETDPLKKQESVILILSTEEEFTFFERVCDLMWFIFHWYCIN